MPYRAPGTRSTEDVAVLRGPDHGLAEGEWIRYWAIFPHSLMGRLTSEATKTTVNTRTSVMSASFDAGTAALARVRMGIIDWLLLDAEGQPVPWQADRAAELVDGLPEETFEYLQKTIGNKGRSLAERDNEDEAPLGEG